MKGDKKMTYNSLFAELLGKELQMQRMREAEKERLIRKATAWDPPLRRKLLVILQTRWEDFWRSRGESKRYPLISQVPKKSSSI